MTSDPATPADQTDPIPSAAADPDEPREQPAAGAVIHLVPGGDFCRPGELCD
ncbi:hypothetical protein GCM10010172_87280 [Paractinoplanes ferrugineus]|uniref:Uncharacterized protein n=1 Tax=Paractinoplanes ferrugineus TaxID=113564 RepID=A0A919MI49_9ACTN|nr:hypothetical protein [Actinoplanes ferrugineus]GIE16503.1 hypothetical protein Afe05nite_83430 [Actinoplanes ferrugineus]